jgi:diamine N-acetyltransferase
MNVPDNMALRPIETSDHKWLVDLRNDPVVRRNLTHPEKITMREHLAWLKMVKNDPRQERFVFTVDGNRVGITKFYSIDQVNGNCVLGADIHKDHRGKGYAKHMWSLMLNFCFKDLDLHRVSLTTAEFNVVGQHVYRQLGFVDEGKMVQSLKRDNIFYDQLCMYMLRPDWEAQK